MVATKDVPTHSGGNIPPPADDDHMAIDTATDMTETSEDVLAVLGADMRKVKDLITTITNLTKLGMTSDILGKIPKIVVVGDQSAGKSSLVDAICGVKLPRSSGTCTRCVTSVYLTAVVQDNEPWSAEVSIVKRYFLTPPGYPALPANKFHPWRESAAQTCDSFRRVHDPEELADVVQRAQMAILNPSKPASGYTFGHYSPDIEVEFSPNIVRVEVKAINAPELSLYDLPGVISQAEDDSKRYLPKIVKNLVKYYVTQEHTLVLLACSVESDLHNSKAASILRNEENNGKRVTERSIGVLTKPDRLPKGQTVNHLRDILGGASFRLGHAYFVAKQPDQVALDYGISPAAARVQEKIFFKTVEPWAVTLASFAHRFGTDKLVESLSLRLAAMTIESLPLLRAEVSRQLTGVVEELSRLPQSPGESAHCVVATAVHDLVLEICKSIEGVFPALELKTQWRQLKDMFKADIARLRPNLKIVSAEEEDEARYYKDVIRKNNIAAGQHAVLLSDEDVPEAETPKNKKRKARYQSEALPIRRNTNATAQDASGIIFTLDRIRETRNQFLTSSIPNSVDPKADSVLIMENMSNWTTPTMKFIKAVELCLRNYVKKAIGDTLAAWRNTLFFREVTTAIEKFLELHVSGLSDVIAQRALRLEMHYLVAEPSNVWTFLYDKEVKYFSEKRLQARAAIKLDGLEAMKKHSKEKRPQTVQDLTKFLGDEVADPFQLEVEAMAKIRAYYEIASLRFVGNMIQSVEGELFEKIKSDLKGELFCKLQIQEGNVNDRCILLLAEDEQRAQRRLVLLDEKKALDEALRQLDILYEKYPNNMVAT